MACCALKQNLSYCKNWSLLDGPYCHAHRCMDSRTFHERWFKKYIVGEHGTPPYTIIMPSKKGQILKDLQSGLITLTKQDILKIPAKERFVDIYLLLLENNFAQFGDHPKLERAGLWLFQILVYHFPFENRTDFEKSTLQVLEKTIEKHLILSSGKALYRFLEFVGVAMQGRRRLKDLMVTYVPTLLETDAAKELSWYSFEELDKIRKEWDIHLKDNSLKRCLTERWLPDIKELYKTEKQIQKMKMDHCKEELMMDRWHPDRVSKLLEAGIDPMDM
jgi:hypothetical protein